MPVTVPIRKFCVIFCTYLALKEAKMNASINNSKRFLFLIFNSLHKMLYSPLINLEELLVS